PRQSHAAASARARSGARNRSGRRATRSCPGRRSRPAVPFLFDERGDIDLRPHVRGARRARDHAATDLHELGPHRAALKANAELVFGHLELRARREAVAPADAERNYHSASLINGSPHGITIPREQGPLARGFALLPIPYSLFVMCQDRSPSWDELR